MSIRQGKKLIASSTTNGFSLFDCKWADHILNNISWLRADTFSWQSGDVYKAAYEHLLSDFENRSGEMFYAWRSDQYGYYLYTTTTTPDSTTVFYDEDFQVDTEHTFSYFDGGILYLDDRPEPEISFQRDPSKDTIAPSVDTVGDITITYYLAEDGHKICLPDQEANLSSLYESTGVAWYYILDTENKQFKLPITKFGFTGIRSGVGEYVAPGLPNITGRTGATCANATPSGAFKRGTYAQTIGGGGGTLYQDNFNASWSNPIYGASDTVQPPATQMYLYFYVGNYVEDLTTIDAGKLAEVVNDFDPETYRDEVNEIKTDATQEINRTTQESIDTLKNMGEVVNYTNITNCITEIPQDIKFEMSDDEKLIIKAGSKVYIPNGPGVFDSVVIPNDITVGGWGSLTGIIIISSGGTGASFTGLSQVYSGATEPTISSGNVWYDTENNIVKRSSDGSSWGTIKHSLPIAIVTANNSTPNGASGIASIDQVFNGFGYIGSTVFALPGVKGLIPNGRNADGSLKSNVLNITSVKTYTLSSTAVKEIRITNAGLYGYRGYIVSDTNPSVNFNLWYNPVENIMYDTAAGTLSTLNATVGISVEYNGTRIVSFTPKTAFHAVDYSDTEYIAHQAMPSDRYVDILSMLPATNGNITAPADGYFVMHKIITSGQHLELMNTTTNLGSTAHFYSNSGNIVGCVFVPVKTGDVVQTVYNSTPTTFRFVYTNGLK